MLETRFEIEMTERLVLALEKIADNSGPVHQGKILLDLTKSQFDIIYEAINHLDWELNHDNQEWGYELEQIEALEDVRLYLRTKL